MRGETAAKNQEFADEAVENGQADQCERSDDVEGGHVRQAGCQASILRHFISAVALMQKAHEDEEGAPCDSFIDGLIERAIQPRERETKDAENAETERAQHRIGYKAPQVGLGQGDAGSIEDADD